MLALVVQLDVLPSVSVKDYVTKLGWDGITLKVILNVQNPYPFDILLKEFNLNVKLGNINFSKISNSSPKSIPSSGSEDLTIKTYIGYYEIFKVLSYIFSQNKRNLSVEGNMVFELKAPNLDVQSVNLPIKIYREF